MATQQQIPSLQGYPRLAALMGEFSDVAIFRRFGSLTALNLMLLQAELIQLEEKLRTVILHNDLGPQPQNRFSESLLTLLETEKTTRNKPQQTTHSSPQQTTRNDTQQLELMDAIRVKLIEYHKLLLYAAQVARLRKPHEENVKFLLRWLRHDEGGANFLQGIELVRTWDESLQRDFVVLSKNDKAPDSLTTWFTPWVMNIYHYCFQSFRQPLATEAGDVFDYEDSKLLSSVNWVISLLATIAASLLPSLIILWLFHVRRTITRIWITVGCTVGIGLFLRLFTNASMKEIFGGSAAFAAVEVVFIGSANGTYAGA